MIKEKKKITKYTFEKTKNQIIIEYARTVILSVIFSVIVTLCLTLHARNEMIKDLYQSMDVKNNIDKKLAEELIKSTDFLTDLKSKNAAVCIYTGDLYQTAGDYKTAEIAYKLAVEKSPANSYKTLYKLVCVLAMQDKLKDCLDVLNNTKDISTKNLIKFKSRSYIIVGDRYYANGKFLSASKCYEKAYFYYSKFSRKDPVVEKSIKKRIVDSYIEVADLMVKNSLNEEAVRFLNKAKKYSPKDYEIRYKLAIILSDLDPEKAVESLEPLLEERPQDIDYSVYSNAYLKASSIAELDGRLTKSKYYRYKIHSIDLFIRSKVVYKNDIDVNILKFSSRKRFFTYPLKGTYEFLNVSNTDMINMYADFVLASPEKDLERVTKQISSKSNPLIPFADEPNVVDVAFKKKIFTKKELENYTINVYLYKDKKFKTLVSKTPVPISR